MIKNKCFKSFLNCFSSFISFWVPLVVLPSFYFSPCNYHKYVFCSKIGCHINLGTAFKLQSTLGRASSHFIPSIEDQASLKGLGWTDRAQTKVHWELLPLTNFLLVFLQSLHFSLGLLSINSSRLLLSFVDSVHNTDFVNSFEIVHAKT